MKIKTQYKKFLPYIIIFLAVLLCELFVFQFSAWKTMLCEPIVIAEEGMTDADGLYESEKFFVGDKVQNINVKLTLTNVDRATVRVILTDEGDRYEYALLDYEMSPETEISGYRDIYPFGKVNTLQVLVMVPEGAQAEIVSITANDHYPMDIKWIRMMVCFAVLALGYLVFHDTGWMKIPCKKGCLWQMTVIVAVVGMLIAFAGLLVRTNPIWTDPVWPHHGQYQQLARALEEGTVVLDDNADPALLEKENPYDTSALMAEGIPFRMDYAFYEGNYYAYFGIIPELLFFLPYYHITGQDLDNYVVVYAFYILLLVGVFGTLWEVVHHYGKKVPFVWYILLSVSVALMPNYVFLLKRPDLYNIPVIAGNAFVFLGTFFWLRALWNEKCRCLWLVIGSLCMACIAGCRPQLLLYTVVVFMAFLAPAIWRSFEKKEKDTLLRIGNVAGFVIPFLVIAAVVMWYNRARFGNPFEFGATLSLTSNDMNHRGFNFSRLFRGMYNFLFQFPALDASYPFLSSAQLEGDYMGKNIVEFCYGGIFWIYPLLFILLYAVLGGYKHLKKQDCGKVGLLVAASVIICGFDINAAGVLQRYMGDMVFGLVLAAILLLFHEFSLYRENGKYLWLSKAAYLAVVWGMAFSFMVFLSGAGGNALEDGNFALYQWIRSYF